MQTKKCSKCKEVKPFSEYHKDKIRKIGIRCKCKACCKKETYEWRIRNRSEYNSYAAMWRAKNPGKQHANDIKRNYGIDISTYESLLKEQDFRCKICGKKHDVLVKKGRLFVDHCHASGKVRGLLCMKCNFAIGSFNDDVELIKKAIAYVNSK